MNAPAFSCRTAVFGAVALAFAARRASAPSTPVASPGALAFPGTIEDVYGSTTIERRPGRVVTGCESRTQRIRARRVAFAWE